MKKIITFLLSLIIAYSPIYVFAGAAEQWNGSPRQMTIADMGMRTRNGIGVENVRAANGMINADITQRVTVDGSNATINTKVSIPANDDTFARRSASHAKNLLKGGAWAAGAAVAMDQILDGVDWVLDPENNTIRKKLNPDELAEYNKYNLKTFWSVDFDNPAVWSNTQQGACEIAGKLLPPYKGVGSGCTFPSGTRVAVNQYNNRNYSPNGASKPTDGPVPDAEMEDAFYKWFKNNPQSITDPVTTYIYSPKDSKGNALPKSPTGTDPSFGPNEITDEMMNNYMEHRNANLQNPYTTTIGDSTQTDTSQNPEGTKTNTKTNPDGSKTETKTDTKVNPDTGEIITTVTETTTKPDGSTSVKTETSTQTKPNPEKTEMPPLCQYAASFCAWMDKDNQHKADEKSLWEKITDWFEWTKEEPDSDNSDNEVETEEPEKLDTAVFKKDRFKVSKQCPSPETHTINLSGISVDFSFDLTPICTVLEFARPALVACSYLYAAYIVIGAARG